MSEAEQEQTFRRQLSWRDGFAIALIVPLAIFATIGPAIATIGSWAVAALFAIACVVGILQNYIYSELASMFPGKPGGIPAYAHEAWRRYFSPVGALTAFGYWAGWAFALSVFALTFGSLIAAQFFSGATWTISTGTSDIGLGHFIGLGAMLAVGAVNILGIRPAVQLNKVLGTVAIVLVGILVIGPFITGTFQASELTWGLGGAGQEWGGIRIAIAFLFVFGWTAYATEICATFTPEYRDPRRDMSLALRTAGLFTLALAVVIPIGLGGTVGDATIANDPGSVYVLAFRQVVGPASAVVTLIIAAALFLIMNSATADAGRALYGIAKADMTIRQLLHLDRHGTPTRAIVAGVIVNVGLLIFVGDILGIIFASNLGYILATVFVLSSFLLLRKDRPKWPRPIRLPRLWMPIAFVLAVYNLVLAVIGGLSPAEAGYGGITEQLIGVGVLAISFILFLYRRLVQDRSSLRLREQVLPIPVAEERPEGDGAASH